jgi:hypothetical protein
MKEKMEEAIKKGIEGLPEEEMIIEDRLKKVLDKDKKGTMLKEEKSIDSLDSQLQDFMKQYTLIYIHYMKFCFSFIRIYMS